NRSEHQPVAVVNYPSDNSFTRITEFKHLTGQEHPKTSIVYEYPCSEGDAYYPIPRRENAEIYRQYQALATAAGVHFVARLATYKYYNMDQVASRPTKCTPDRKSTRLNSSHMIISYAVYSLK